MKMKKKIISSALALMLTASLLTGCGKSNGLSALDFSNTTLSGTITSVDGDKVTISMLGGSGNGRMGNRGNGEAKGNRDAANPKTNSNVDGQTPPNMPEDSNGEAPEDTPSDGNATDNTFNGKSFGNMLPQGGSTFTLTITDESLLQECTMDDITEGSLITITFGDDNTITSITVMRLTNNQNSDISPEQQESNSESEL